MFEKDNLFLCSFLDISIIIPYQTLKLKNQRGNTMKIMIFLIALLNIIDGFLTYYGLKHDLIEEANAIMARNSPEAILYIKLFLSLVLLFIMNKIPKKGYLYLLILIALIFYLVITLFHVRWILYYLH